MFDYLIQNDMFRFDEIIAFVSDVKKIDYKKYRNEWLDIVSIEMMTLLNFDFLIVTEPISQEIYKKIISVIDEKKVMDWRNYFESVIYHKFQQRYGGCKDKEIINTIKYMSHNGAQVFNGEFTGKQYNIDVGYDNDNCMFYVIYDNKKMYMKKSYTNEDDVRSYVRGLYLEQDIESPHCYFDGRLNVKKDSIVIDAGVAEGNFALSVIDNVSKIYLIECDSEWIEALKLTMLPYKDKVVFCEKMLSDYSDENTTCIDDLVPADENVNFMKFDVEGFEILSLIGARKTILSSPDFQCAVCSYHKHNDQILIESLLHDMGVKTYVTKGYMFFRYESDCFINPELRHGLVQGIKEVQADA